jgi:hypothetical protein
VVVVVVVEEDETYSRDGRCGGPLVVSAPNRTKSRLRFHHLTRTATEGAAGKCSGQELVLGVWFHGEDCCCCCCCCIARCCEDGIDRQRYYRFVLIVSGDHHDDHQVGHSYSSRIPDPGAMEIHSVYAFHLEDPFGL